MSIFIYIKKNIGRGNTLDEKTVIIVLCAYFFPYDRHKRVWRERGRSFKTQNEDWHHVIG